MWGTWGPESFNCADGRRTPPSCASGTLRSHCFAECRGGRNRSQNWSTLARAPKERRPPAAHNPYPEDLRDGSEPHTSRQRVRRPEELLKPRPVRRGASRPNEASVAEAASGCAPAASPKAAAEEAEPVEASEGQRAQLEHAPEPSASKQSPRSRRRRCNRGPRETLGPHQDHTTRPWGRRKRRRHRATRLRLRS